jgi:hypothetical protein
MDRGLGGPRVVLDMMVKRKIPSPCWKLNPRTPIAQPIRKLISWHLLMILLITAISSQAQE